LSHSLQTAIVQPQYFFIPAPSKNIRGQTQNIQLLNTKVLAQNLGDRITNNTVLNLQLEHLRKSNSLLLLHTCTDKTTRSVIASCYQQASHKLQSWLLTTRKQRSPSIA
jgi:hypothetical protein